MYYTATAAEILNAEGKAGWELVSVAEQPTENPVHRGDTTTFAYFKRPMTS